MLEEKFNQSSIFGQNRLNRRHRRRRRRRRRRRCRRRELIQLKMFSADMMKEVSRQKILR